METGGWSKLMTPEFWHARQKGIKIYSVKEISSGKSELEQARRQFSNEKAEQLCTRSETANLGKTTIYGIIDVAWTLRKTLLLLDEARKLQQNEEELFPDDDSASWERGTAGKQKAKTIDNNINRMEVSHQNVIDRDKELEKVKKRYESCTTEEKKLLGQEHKKVKTEFDGAYTELKRAQDALTKALKHKKDILERRLKERTVAETLTTD